MARTDTYSLRHRRQRAAADADQSEFAAIRLGKTVVASGTYDDRVASALDDHADDAINTEEWARNDLTADTAVGSVQEEIERRHRLLGTAYPFVLDGGTLSYSASPSRTYEFMLVTAVAPSLSSGVFARLPRVFERLTTDLVALWLGDSDAIHTGAPRDASVGTTFSKAMLHVCESFSEPHWLPQRGLPADPANGDHGLDFVVRKRAPDNRPIGQLFVIGQCACGNDWQTKFEDLTHERLRRWFQPFSHVPAVRAFATPHHLDEGWLNESSNRAGLIFDRARFAMLATRTGAAAITTRFVNDFNELIDAVINHTALTKT